MGCQKKSKTFITVKILLPGVILTFGVRQTVRRSSPTTKAFHGKNNVAT